MPPVALITGGSSGLGLAIAKELFARGMSVVLLARDPDKLARAQRLVAESLGDSTSACVEVHPCDIADRDALASVFDRVRSRHGRLDYLVLNAGTTTVDLLAEHDSAQAVVHTLEVNLLGAVTATYLASPMLGAGSRVLYVSSGFGLVGCAGYASYCASKGGLNLFAEAMRQELMSRGVAVHLACPGDIDTPMFRHELDVMPGWVREKMGRGTPLAADVVACRILKACKSGAFLITPSADVKLLQWVRKLLPTAASTWLIDRSLPRPPATRDGVRASQRTKLQVVRSDV